MSDLTKVYHGLMGSNAPDFLVYSGIDTTFGTTFTGATTTLVCGAASSTKASGVAHTLSILAGWSSIYVEEGKELVTAYTTSGNALVREIRFEKDYEKLVSVNVISSNNLTTLSLQNCPLLTTISGVSSNKSTFFGCSSINELILTNCPSFLSLSIQGSFSNLSCLQGVKSTLRNLTIRRNYGLTVADLSEFTNLELVSFTGNYESTSWACTNLHTINVSDSTITSLTVYGCVNLVNVDCTNCTSLTNISGWSSYKTHASATGKMANIILNGCTAFTGLSCSGAFANLDFLAPVASTLINLTILANSTMINANLAGFTAMSNLTFGANSGSYTTRWGCYALQTLNLTGAAVITATVYGCHALNTILAVNCTRLATINGYNVTKSTGSLSALSTLDMTGSMALRNITAHNTPNINITFDNCNYTTLWFVAGNKSTININEFLAKCVAIAPHITSTPTVTLTGNAAPTTQGLIDKDTLINQYGWVVTTT